MKKQFLFLAFSVSFLLVNAQQSNPKINDSNAFSISRHSPSQVRHVSSKDTEAYEYVGIARVTENWRIMGTTKNVRLFRHKKYNDSYAIANIYRYEFPEADNWLLFDLLQEGDTIGDPDYFPVYIDQPDLVYFYVANIGTHYQNDSLSCPIYIIHPVEFGITDVQYSRVVSYQKSGFPKAIQFAPLYYVETLGYWDYSQQNDIFTIQFPEITNSLPASKTTLYAESNNSSGIEYANYTATLDDGTILGFYRSNSDVYFCGAITLAETIEVPDSIVIGTEMIAVTSIGRYRNMSLDFEEAINVKEVYLPATIQSICYLPSNIEDLHIAAASIPSLYDSDCIPNSTTIWVPQSAIREYQNSVTDSYSPWYMKTVHFEGWEPKSYTIDVRTPGTFAQVLLGEIEQWTDVDELIVTGSLDETDLAYLSRLKNMTRLDLSQTKIKTITGCTGLNNLRTILLPSTVTIIQQEAFLGCSSLKEISMPNVEVVGNSAFTGCSLLSSVSLPAATTIGDRAFYNCSSLSSISLPTATTIGDWAFEGCYSLSSVSLPAATTIGYEAFRYCSSLSSVSLPAATTIGDWAFDGCYSLSSVSLPAATTIGGRAFGNCSSLSSVSLPNTLVYLGDDAFGGCRNLTDVYCYVISPLSTTAFSETGAIMTTLHVPAFALNAYILHDNWYSFYNIVPIEEKINDVIISSDFTITNYSGLADVIDLSVVSGNTTDDGWYRSYSAGHLTVSAPDVLKVRNYNQEQAYDGHSTLITYNEIKAENITLKYVATTGKWNFITVPFDVNVEDITYTDGTLWVIRKYSGADRANMTGNTWQNMIDGMTMKAGEGYILHCENEGTDYPEFTFKAVNNSNKNNIFTYQDVTTPLSTYVSELAHNRSWNLVGNPYPCYYDIKSIEHNGVITVWNGYGYTAYSLLDDDYTLKPNEAFFVQCPDGAASMKFKVDGRTHVAINNDDYDYSQKMRKSDVMSAASRYVYNLSLCGNDYSDKARIVVNESAKMDYEISCDASKFMSNNNAVPQIYVLENGQRFAIDERPLADGRVSLGVHFGEAGEYTIALNGNPNEDWCLILKDNDTGKSIDLTKEPYTFTATGGTSDVRFSLAISVNPTNINGVNDDDTHNTVYDIVGRQLSTPQNGINIINGKKIIVR